MFENDFNPSISDSFHKISLVYKNIGNTDKAYEYLEKSLEVKIKIFEFNEITDIDIDLGNLKNLYNGVDFYEKAFD